MEYVRQSLLGSTVTQSFAAPGKSYLLPAVGGFVAIIFVVMIVYIIIQSRETKPKMETTGPLDLFNPESPVVVDRPTVRVSMGSTYTLSFYIRIDGVPDMRSGSTPVFTWPGVWNMSYNPSQQEMNWDFNQMSDSPDTPMHVEKHTRLPNVPMQKWTQVTMTYEGRTADFYVDGKLIESVTLINVTSPPNSSITIVPKGIMGQVAFVQVWSRRLTVHEVANNYLDTSDSQGRPFLGPGLMNLVKEVKVPNLFCPQGNCTAKTPVAPASQTWEFAYE